MPSPLTPSGEGTGRVERSGQLSDEQLRLLIESVKDYAIFLMDPGGHVVTWNLGGERIKGYRASEILGEHFSRFYSEEDRAAGLPAKALAGAAAQDRFEESGWRVRKDGSRFYTHATITALYDGDGNLQGFAKITQDVTMERQAERMLREREQQLAEAQAIAQLGSFEWEVGADQVRWTAELRRICGLPPEPTTTTLEAFVACVHPDDRPRVMEAIRRAAVDGIPFRQEQRIVCPTGEERVLLSWGRVMHDGQTRPSRVGVVFQDVSEQRHRDERLAEASLQAELARQLQRGLLPTLSLDSDLPIRTRYRPGLRRALLGADFYDALELPDGTVATLIGDVAGHGPDGAAVGVSLRAAWRALTLSGHGPDEVLDGLHEVLVRDRPSEEMFTTVCCVLISPDRHEIVVASAGHPPPLLVSNGTVQVLDVVGQPALGILERGHAWRTARMRGGEAWILLCYTDGLVEGLQAPGSVERFGIEALAGTATRLLAEGRDMDGLLDGLLEVVLEANGGDLSDDVAMLCVSNAPAGDSP
jgi:PAS domain S-box-containing protein